jgi:hypothetical protein
MKIKNVIFTALSALILTGCGTGKALDEEGSESGSEVDVIEENEEVVEEANENEVSTEQLESPYNEIAEYFSEWRLPEEGILPETHEAYYGLAVEATAYENGYIFETETGELLGRFYGENESAPVPTEEQSPGVTKGIISTTVSDLTVTTDNNPVLKEGKLDAQSLGYLLPMIVANFREVVEYSNQEDLSTISIEILNSANEMRQELEAGVSEERLENLNSQYSEMVNKIFLLGKAIKPHEQL